MSRRNPWAKWTLPDVVDPPSKLCFTIEVPDNIYHVAAFRGALLSLASATKWQDDTAHTAKDVAIVWKEIVNNVRVCTTCEPDNNIGITLEEFMSQQIRISPDDSCIIQMWCIDHWEDWYNPNSCISTGGRQQTSVDGPPEAGETQTYCFTIEARTPYLFPVPVQTSDVITVSGTAGAWSDGVLGLISHWNCPDGSRYILGACGGITTNEVADPMPTENHMGLIAFVAGDYYFIGAGASFVGPAGISDEQLLFLPNTDDRNIALGSVSCCVDITRAGLLPIELTYSFGSGPSHINSGTVFTLTSSNNAGQQRFDIQANLECVKWEVLSSSGWVTVGSSGSPFWADCASGPHNHTGADVAPEVWLANVDGVQIIANGASVFTCQVRVTRL